MRISTRRFFRPRLTTFVLLAAAVVLFVSIQGPLGKLVSQRNMRLKLEQARRPDMTVRTPSSGSAGDQLNTPENLSSYLKCLDPEWKGSVQDTLCMKRFDLLPNYKNPCWIDWTGQLQRLRCLPYFHLLGVDKSGTTDLHSRIVQHPHILYNNGGIGKETYFWCWVKYGQWMRRTVTPKTFFNYLRAFDKPTAHIANTTDSRGFHYLITGDGTPMDFWDFRAWPLIPQNKGLKELYSDYVFLGYGLSPEKFRIDVPRALDMMEKCLKINTTRQCVFSNDTYVNLPMRLHIGMYSVFMKEWLAVFPRDRFYILRTEDYQANMKEHLRRIYKFLDVEPLSDKSLDEIVNKTRRHVTQRKVNLTDMYPDTRELLTKFYSPYNRELAKILEDPGYLWTS
ncbi:hypothetical protein BaRGS_00029368 [Batillaria attramentaria]|uniref:Sulfotransferase domain-containing protein n=1 Tax=Batillaria attramentaria TaxID=370345 RepID=A0ABD0JWD7_9CAEN